jgi:hypothetical protein
VGLTVPSITAAVAAAGASTATTTATTTASAAAAAAVATELAMAEATQALQAAVVKVNAQVHTGSVCRLSLQAQRSSSDYRLSLQAQCTLLHYSALSIMKGCVCLCALQLYVMHIGHCSTGAALALLCLVAYANCC